MKRLLATLAVLGLLLSACGGDDAADPIEAGDEVPTDDDTGTDDDDGEPETGTESDDDYAAALATDLQAGNAFPGTDAQIECLATGFVDAIGGPDALREAGVTAEELVTSESPESLGLDIDPQQVADDLVETFETCDYDLVELLAATLGTGAPEDFEACVREQVSDDELARLFADTIADPADEEAGAAILPILEACAEPVGGEAPTTTAE